MLQAFRRGQLDALLHHRRRRDVHDSVRDIAAAGRRDILGLALCWEAEDDATSRDARRRGVGPDARASPHPRLRKGPDMGILLGPFSSAAPLASASPVAGV